MRNRHKVAIAIAAVMAVGTGVAVGSLTAPSTPAEFTYGVFDRPQTDADREAIAMYTGPSSRVSLETARLLGADKLGNQYFAVRDETQVCLVVVHSADASGGACNPLGKESEEVIWLRSGDDKGSRVAILVPDGYAIDAVKGGGDTLVRESNLVVLSVSGDAQQSITIPGLKGREDVRLDIGGI